MSDESRGDFRPLILNDGTNAWGVGRGTFLVFFDETGNESFADPRNPYFGVGACAVRIEDYWDLVDGPWRELKAQHFGGSETHLHAADLRSPTRDQLTALAEFFRGSPFGRSAAVIHSADWPDPLWTTPYGSTLSWILAGLPKFLDPRRDTTLAMLFESSARANPIVQYAMTHLALEVWEGETRRPMPTHKFFVTKGLLAGAEVADFVAHAAGTAVRAWHAAGEERSRRDFDAVFNSFGDDVAQFTWVRGPKRGPN